jgi:hypothetical protein
LHADSVASRFGGTRAICLARSARESDTSPQRKQGRNHSCFHCYRSQMGRVKYRQPGVPPVTVARQQVSWEQVFTGRRKNTSKMGLRREPAPASFGCAWTFTPHGHPFCNPRDFPYRSLTSLAPSDNTGGTPAERYVRIGTGGSSRSRHVTWPPWGMRFPTDLLHPQTWAFYGREIQEGVCKSLFHHYSCGDNPPRRTECVENLTDGVGC